jgi:hypothetical protein
MGIELKQKMDCTTNIRCLYYRLEPDAGKFKRSLFPWAIAIVPDGIKTDQKRVWTTNPFVQGGPGYSPFRLVPAIFAFACLIKFHQKASSRRQI